MIQKQKTMYASYNTVVVEQANYKRLFKHYLGMTMARTCGKTCQNIDDSGFRAQSRVQTYERINARAIELTCTRVICHHFGSSSPI